MLSALYLLSIITCTHPTQPDTTQHEIIGTKRGRQANTTVSGINVKKSKIIDIECTRITSNSTPFANASLAHLCFLLFNHFFLSLPGVCAGMNDLYPSEIFEDDAGFIVGHTCYTEGSDLRSLAQALESDGDFPAFCLREDKDVFFALLVAD